MTPIDHNLCEHCDRWREEHYRPDGSWRHSVLIDGKWTRSPCAEYLGTVPDPGRRKKRDAELQQLEQQLVDEQQALEAFA